MKFCQKCGKEIRDEAVVCIGCGCPVPGATVSTAENSELTIAIKVLMILSTILGGIALIPLAWCIPMTVSYFRKVRTGEPIGIGFKICTLLFVNFIAGILMLCGEEF